MAVARRLGARRLERHHRHARHRRLAGASDAVGDGRLRPPQGIRGCQFGNGSDSAHLGQPFACNNKLIGAYAFLGTYMANTGADANEFCNNTTKVCSPRDSEGHGTHTTTTAGGDCVTSATLYGVERGPVCGIAPGAHIIT